MTERDPEKVRAYLDSLDFVGCEPVRMVKSEFDSAMRGALAASLPPGAGLAFNIEGNEAVVTISKPGNTREVLAAARQRLGR